MPVPPQLASGKSPKSSEKGASQASAATSKQIEPVEVRINKGTAKYRTSTQPKKSSQLALVPLKNDNEKTMIF